MRIEERKIYKFNELSEDSQKIAIQKWRDSNHQIEWQSELFESLKALFEKTNNVKLKDWNLGLYGDSYLKIEFNDSAIEELTGVRALTWLENNLFSNLRMKRSEYLKDRKNNFKYGYRPGKINDCPLTGYCADHDFLDAITKNILSGMNLKDAFKSLADTYVKLLQSEYDYQNSEEYIKETIEANDYEFLEDGTMY